MSQKQKGFIKNANKSHQRRKKELMESLMPSKAPKSRVKESVEKPEPISLS